MIAPPRPVRRRATTWLLVVALVAMLPVPWLHMVHDEEPVGLAWRLDGRLQIDGRSIDPPGRWSWLTVGRPPHVIELARDWLVGGGTHTSDLRDAPARNRPAINEPIAVAVGLQHAGVPAEIGLLVEVSEPLVDGLPETTELTRLAGIALDSPAAWAEAQARMTEPAVVQTSTGDVHLVTDGRLPWARIDVTPSADGLEAGIASQLAQYAPVSWFRDLALGRSHGMMVALLTYVDASGVDLAEGRHIAGTGGIDPDGSITRIGGLRAKATAARDRGADVLLYPAAQADQLEGFDPGSMQLHGIETLRDAITALEGEPHGG